MRSHDTRHAFMRGASWRGDRPKSSRTPKPPTSSTQALPELPLARMWNLTRMGNPSFNSINMNYMLLRTEQLTKHYGRITALDRLDLEIVPGEIVGMLWPYGFGKWTVLRLMLRFLRPTSGRASISAHDCWVDSVNARRQV